MINVRDMYYDLRETMDDAAAKKIAGYLGKVYDEVQSTVKASDFQELKEIVGELADAQKRTETCVEELAEAQKRTETRMDELADAQKRTEEAVLALVESQKGLQDAQKKLSQQVGGLSDTIGGDIEDISYSMLCHFLPDEFGWQVGDFARVWRDWGGKELDQIDIFAKAADPDRPDVPIWVVGEAKYNLTMKELNHFIQLVARAREYLDGEVFPLCFCYRARPAVQQKAGEAGIRILFSYGKML
jgi:predicted transcriptional regulator